MSFEWLFFLAVVAGGVGAVSGMGGGVVLVPALTFFGVDIKMAIAIGNISAIAVSTSAASGYVRRHMPSFNTISFLEVFAVIGALVGAALAVLSNRQLLFFLWGGTLLISWVVLWRQQSNESRPATQPDNLSKSLQLEGSYYDYAEGRTIAYRGTRAHLAGPLMTVAGLTTGLLGMGGSAFVVLINEGIVGLPTKVSLTTSNLIIGVMALAGTNVYLEAGLINPQLAAPVILGVPLGALIGSKLLVHLKNRVARLIFLSILIVLGIQMIARGFRGS